MYAMYVQLVDILERFDLLASWYYDKYYDMTVAILVLSITVYVCGYVVGLTKNEIKKAGLRNPH